MPPSSVICIPTDIDGVHCCVSSCVRRFGRGVSIHAFLETRLFSAKMSHGAITDAVFERNDTFRGVYEYVVPSETNISVYYAFETV